MGIRANFETVKTLGFAGISAVYADVGSPTTHPIRAFCISNNTQGDMYFSIEDTAIDQLFVAAGNFKLFDVQSNINPQFDDKYVLPIGTQFSVKQITAPVDGAVYIECMF